MTTHFGLKSSSTILYTSNLEKHRHIHVYLTSTCTFSSLAVVIDKVLAPRQIDMSEAERPSCFLMFCQLVTDYKMKNLFPGIRHPLFNFSYGVPYQ